MNRNNRNISGTRTAWSRWRGPLEIAGIYVLVAGLWIVLSDRVLLWLFANTEQLTRYQTFKGWFFVVATATILAWLVRRNMTSLQTEVDTCQSTRERFRALVETIPHGIQECDTQGVITLTNTGYDQIFGLKAGEALGMTIWDKEVSEESRQELKRYLAHLVTEQPEPTPFVTRNGTADGREIDVQVDWAYLRDETGGVVGFASVITDITERMQAQEAILASDRMKSELITTAAHEFRTPLTAIQGFSELLLDEHDFPPAEQREYLDIIYEKSIGLTEMLDNLLNISRVEAGLPMPMTFAPCAVSDVVDDVALSTKILATRHRVEIALADAEAMVAIDRRKIGQVLENLLSNGVKYSPPGSLIRLTGALSGAVYRFEVVDQGIGISADHLEHVFERFYRVDQSDTGPSGFGIGMAIVKHIVESHGSEIRIESEPDKGTTVSFDLPLADQPASPAE